MLYDIPLHGYTVFNQFYYYLIDGWTFIWISVFLLIIDNSAINILLHEYLDTSHSLKINT